MDIVECLNTMCEAFLEIESEEIKGGGCDATFDR